MGAEPGGPGGRARHQLPPLARREEGSAETQYTHRQDDEARVVRDAPHADRPQPRQQRPHLHRPHQEQEHVGHDLPPH
eukprot:6995113-Alexandrium_andersonii.AAC.1